MNEIDAPNRDERRGASRQASQLVGRDRELGRIRAFLASARTDGGAFLVTGEPGVGKTELLDAAAREASAAGTRIFRAAGVEFEAGTSYSGLNQVLLPLLPALQQLPTVHRDALNVALGFGEGAPPSRLVVSNAALVLLRQAGGAQPLLVVIDDLPWLDRASAGVLSFVARRLEGSRVGLLGASRTGEEEFFEHAGLPGLEVARLDEDAAAELLDDRFPDLATTVRSRILAEAQGNPLALLELPEALGPGMRTSGTTLFRHPLIRSAVVDGSQADERRAAHRALADMWADQLDRRAWHLAEAAVEHDESVAVQLEAAAARILARGDAVGAVKALARSSELSPRRADRSRRLAAAAYIGADVAGDLGNRSRVLADLRRGDTELEGSLQAAVAASVFLLQGDGDVATGRGLYVIRP